MSLFTQCINALVKPNVIEKQESILEMLPASIKTVLLTVLCKRGLINGSLFKKLINLHVTDLDLSECEVDDEILRSLCNCKSLLALDLSLGRRQTRQISTEVLISLFTHLHFLRTIIIPHCKEINDEVIKVISQTCKELKEIHIPYSSITDHSLQLIGNNLTNLSAINIAGTQVSDFGISSLISDALTQTLVEMDITNCPNITLCSSLIISDKLPNIKIFNCSLIAPNEAVDWAISKISKNAKQIFWTV